MGVFYTWIRNIVIYMILNTIIMNLLGNSSYKKYVSIVSGMILVLIVILPLAKYLKVDENLDYYLESNEFTVEASDFKNDLKHMEEKQGEAVFAEYRNRIKAQVGEVLKGEGLALTDFDLTFDRNIESESFGEILHMEVKATNQEEGKERQRIRIDEIEISDIDKMQKKEEKAEVNPPSPAEINIKIKLSDFYNIDPDNINISIQGG